ncbi:hypothetical protein [Micromonospora arborensis]|uniref:hypothetical protein n=1 Tax=Micromonospora arborensis TaxID=2116518 RepID=UPI00371FF8FF
MAQQNKDAIQHALRVTQLGKSGDLRGALALAEQGVKLYPGPVLSGGRTFGWLRDVLAEQVAKGTPKVAEPVAPVVAQPFAAPVAAPVEQPAPVQVQAKPGPGEPGWVSVNDYEPEAPVAVPVPEVAKSTLRIVHNVEEGTRLLGTAKGDGVNVVMGKNGQKWRFYMAGKFWYIWGSRGGKADRARINRAAGALRAAGWTVEVEIDDVDHATGQVAAPKVSKAEQLRQMRAYNHAESGLLWVLTNQGGVDCGKRCGATDLALRTSKVVRNDETNLPMAICLPCAGVTPAPVAEPAPAPEAAVAAAAAELPEIIAPKSAPVVEPEPVVEPASTADLAAELRELSQALEPYRAKPVRRSEVERMSVAELRALSVTNFDKAWNELVRRLDVAESRQESAPVVEPVAERLLDWDDCACGNGKRGTLHESRPGKACRIPADRHISEPSVKQSAQPAAPVAEPTPAEEPETEQVSPVKAAALAAADVTRTFEIAAGGRHTVREVRSELHRQVTLPVNKLVTSDDDLMKISVFHDRAKASFTITAKLSSVVDPATTLDRIEQITTGIRGVGASV